MLIQQPFDVAMAIRARRRQLKLRQIELAKEAKVGREWLVDLEHGKPTVELGLVLRTLETLGLEVALAATAAPPPWTIPLTAAAAKRAEALAEYRPPQPRKPRPSPPAPKEYRWQPE